jgi:hypothetical protein
MLYDSNGFKPYICMYIYVLFFQKLSMCHGYIYSIGPTPKSIEYQFFGQFLMFSELSRQFSLDMSSLWPGHIRLARHVRLLAWTCLGLRFQPIYIRGLSTPSNPNLAKPLSSLSCSGQGSPKVIWDLLHRIPSVSRGFDSPSPQDLHTLSGSLSPKVFSRFSFNFFDLLLNFINVRSLYLGAPLGCHYLALNLV